MSGKFKTFIGTTLTLGHPPDCDSLHEVSPSAAVTINGKTARMEDLKPDDDVEVANDPVTTVTAKRNPPPTPVPAPATPTTPTPANAPKQTPKHGT